MGGVVIIGDGLAARAVAEVLRNSGAPILLAPGTCEIIGIHPSFVIGDDPCVREIQPTPPKFGGQRPYLKRKKGRA